MDPNPVEICELQSQIGLNEELTDKVLCKVKTLNPSSVLFPIYNLLLLERYEATLPLISAALHKSLDIEYIKHLQKSKYYLQRKSTPYLIKDIDFREKKEILRTSLYDPICEVVKEAVRTIKEATPFNEEELIEIAIELFNSKYTVVKTLSIDILALIKESSFLLMDAVKCNNWRVRLNLASCIQKFNPEDQTKIISEIKDDIVDEVRIELSKNLTSLEWVDMLQDSCEHVRANYLRNIVDLIEDEKIFKMLIEDQSWEVKKILLFLKGDLFKKITIPLIKSHSENVEWRIKYEILLLIEEKIENEYTTKLMVGFLIKNIKDKVCEIRNKAQSILVQIIRSYDWIDEYYYELQEIVNSCNYLFRISIIPVVVEYDLKKNTNLSQSLKRDKIINVRDFYNDYTRDNSIKLNYEEASSCINGFEDSQVESTVNETMNMNDADY